MQHNTKTTQVTKEAQTKVSEALTVFYDAQLALQKDALDTARATFEGALALQRAGLRAMTRAMDAVQTTTFPAPEQIQTQFRSMVASFPGMTPEAADKMAKDVAQTFVTVRDTTGQQMVAVRQAATQAATQYEQMLAAVETQAKDGFKAAAESSENATKVASHVTGQWIDAMFDAVNAAVKAAEDTQVEIQKAAEKATPAMTTAPKA